ncbi:MAG: amidase family protein, partial [Chloroflexota bacterium]|nr:amidase family protein [Chloroflexota bacterium]
EDPDDPLSWYARWAIEEGLKVTGSDYAQAVGERDRMIQQFTDEFEKYDILLSPTMAVTAFSTDQYPQKIEGQDPYPNPAWGFLPFTHPINPIGFTAASIPCGFDSEGMPVGLHIIGRHGDEETVLAVSAAFEAARPWIQQRPKVS